jgi:hypothetical protein
MSHTLRSYLSTSLASLLSIGFPFGLSLAHRPLLRSPFSLSSDSPLPPSFAPHTLRTRSALASLYQVGSLAFRTIAFIF